MIHTLTSQIRQYKRDSFLAPLFTMLESVMELTIPLMMASIIDDGINTGEMSTVYRVGAMMLVAADCACFLEFWLENLQPMRQQVFPVICAMRCLPTSSAFLFPTSTNILPLGW